eukprot:3889849-Pyramimonas_sp.AAC.1
MSEARRAERWRLTEQGGDTSKRKRGRWTNRQRLGNTPRAPAPREPQGHQPGQCKVRHPESKVREQPLACD